MKKLLILPLLFISIGIQAQFFKPVRSDLFTNITVDSRVKGSTIILARPAITLNAIQWNWDKEAKSFNANAFQSIGLGAGLMNYIDTPDGPFCNYGVNALILLGTDISAALTFSGLGIINVGVTYNISIKQFGILTGVQIKF
jgi:hypothetical protein